MDEHVQSSVDLCEDVKAELYRRIRSDNLDTKDVVQIVDKFNDVVKTQHELIKDDREAKRQDAVDIAEGQRAKRENLYKRIEFFIGDVAVPIFTLERAIKVHHQDMAWEESNDFVQPARRALRGVFGNLIGKLIK